MKYKQYLDDIKNIEDRTFFSLSDSSSVSQQVEYLRFKAAAMYFTGKDSLSFNPTHYDTYLRNKKLTDREFENVTSLESDGFLDVIGADKLNPKRVAIYCSFHMGSYTSTVSTLVVRDMNLALVLGADAYEEKASMFEQAANNWKSNSGQTSRFCTINGQGSNAIISMIKNLKRNNNLFFFIDGNKGTNMFELTNEALVEVDVCQGKIQSRRGISYLAHYLRVPIVPVVSYRPAPNKIIVQIFDEISPDGTESDFCRLGTQKIWAIFSQIFQAYPMQWESMVFSHKFRCKGAINIENFDMQREYIFNKEEYGFYVDVVPTLFSFVSLDAIKLPRGYGEFLLKMAKKEMIVQGSLLKELIKDSTSLNQLIEKKILVAV